MLLKREELKAQCRLDPELTDEDVLIDLIGRAVQKRTETYLNRKLYAPDASIPVEDPDGLYLEDDIKMGMLMLAGHFYENRSSVTDFEQTEVPQSFNWLVSPYRFTPL
ncbi:head-tail connector protein [Serratia liquefaciens]